MWTIEMTRQVSHNINEVGELNGSHLKLSSIRKCRSIFNTANINEMAKLYSYVKLAYRYTDPLNPSAHGYLIPKH